jgi:hypothetical protein
MGGIHEGHPMIPKNKPRPTVDQMRQALMQKANMPHMAGGGILQDVIKPTPVAKKPNELSGVVLSGASWLAGDEKTKLANQAFGQDVTNTAVGGQKTADVLNQLNVFERDGGTFAPGTTVVLDIGANDIATGVDPAITRANLDEIVSRLGENGVSIILSAQPFANSFQEAIDNPNLVMNEMYSDIANNNPNVTLVDAMSGFLNQKNLMDESGFHLNNEQSKADYIGKFADAYKATHPTQNTVDTTDINTNPIGALPTNNVQDTTTQLTGTNQQSSPLQQAAVVDQTPPTPQEPIQQMSYKMPEYQMESTPSFKDFGNYGDVMERAEGGEVRTQQPFDYDNPSHVRNVANIAAKHRDFNQIPDAAKHLAGVLSQGSYKFVEDPRIQSAIKQAGHNGYYISGKDGKQQIIRKAEGGAVLPIEQIKAQMMNRFKGLGQLQSIGAEEAPSMGVKAYVPTSGSPDADHMPVGGIDTAQGDLPVGGIDMSKQQPGQQLMPNAPPAPAGAQAGMNQVPRGDKIPTMDGTGMPPNPNANPNQMGSNILSMTPQGQAMAALKPQGLASGGQVSIDQMRNELLNRQRPLAMTDDHGYADGGKVGKASKKDPKNTVKAYKLFRVHPKHPGKLFPLFIGKNDPVEMGKWVDAEHIPTKGFAERPGWHAGDLPVATHIGTKSDNSLNAPDTRPDNQVWTEIEMPHDVDWQSEANRRGTNAKGKVVPVRAHITDQVPTGGHYRYKTNPNMTGNWLIGGAMKVNRVLDDAEVKKINKAAGASDLPRAKKQKISDYGFAEGGSLHYEPAPALNKQQIEEHAERIARQMAGEDNPNKKSKQQLEREKTLQVDIKSGGKEIPMPVINHESIKGSSMVGVPGDPSRGGVVPRKRNPTRLGVGMPKAGEYLRGVGGQKLESDVPMLGGYKYGAYGHPKGWASDLGASAGLFNVVKKLYEENPESDIYGQYHKMTPASLNHAVHTLDSVLSHHQPHNAPPEKIAELNHLMRNVKTTTSKHDIPYPTFPGFENPNDIMLQGIFNSGMRKKMIGLLSKDKYMSGGKQKMDDLIFALTHPELRNIETGAGGSAILKFDPTGDLKGSVSPHTTYGHDIPSKLIGKTRYTTPFQLLAPRSNANAIKEIKAMGKEKTVVPFNQAKMNIIREPIDEQYINQLGEYETAMRKRLGYKSGGKVKLHDDQDTMQLALSKKSKKAK